MAFDQLVMIGNGKSGSWKIRGEQLGRAMGARLMTREVDIDSIRKYSGPCIFVKRPRFDIVDEAKFRKRKVIWDCVDFWRQPEMNNDLFAAKNCALEIVGRMKPDLIICATNQQMFDFMEAGITVPMRVLHHHARPGQQVNEIRKNITVIGYEGAEDYLSQSASKIKSMCRDLGCEFIVNPSSLAQLDVVIAMRFGSARGIVPRNWKSNVKIANAQATGTPVIANAECGYKETTKHAFWAESVNELEETLHAITDHSIRLEKSVALLQEGERFTLEETAEKYKRIIRDFL